ncbi:uncharacterized protein LOC106661162 [Cimex lectularius]|uniref:Uncharacterized protein n=1 Tax=Cimex lectularius TaxID=79782 RepID=A0A8I6R6Z2_CIMLE|nr:uncharacterized protein LOC106661162 [Cimex lectularius]
MSKLSERLLIKKKPVTPVKPDDKNDKGEPSFIQPPTVTQNPFPARGRGRGRGRGRLPVTQEVGLPPALEDPIVKPKGRGRGRLDPKFYHLLPKTDDNKDNKDANAGQTEQARESIQPLPLNWFPCINDEKEMMKFIQQQARGRGKWFYIQKQ